MNVGPHRKPSRCCSYASKSSSTTFLENYSSNAPVILKNSCQQDIWKAVVGFLSARFTSVISANLSMPYTLDPSTSPGRCYLSLLTLFASYKSTEAFDEVARTSQKRNIRCGSTHLLVAYALTLMLQGRLHCGEYFTPSFTALLYKDHDPEFFASISSFKKIAEKFDPDHRMWNEFMDRTIWSVV